MTSGVRVSDLNVSSHRRLVYKNVIEATRSVFNLDYDRERQLVNLKVTQKYPYEKLDYPCVVVDYQNQTVQRAGVGHYEYFPDPYGRLRKWFHNRFEGTIYFNVFALSTLDRDILSDAVTELITFGVLYPQLNRFFEVMYPTDFPIVDPGGPYAMDYSFTMLSQMMFNSDEVRNGGDSATIAAWQPEDVLVYSSSLYTDLHGGYYNTNTNLDLRKVTRIVIDAYQTDQGHVDLPFPEHAEIAWDPPFHFIDSDMVLSKGVISGESYVDNVVLNVFDDAGRPVGVAHISANEYVQDYEPVTYEIEGTVIGQGSAFTFAEQTGTVIGIANITSPNFFERFDAGQVTGVANISAVNYRDRIDAATITSIGVVEYINNIEHTSDGTVIGVSNIFPFAEQVATIIGTTVLSAVENTTLNDALNVVGVGVVSGAESVINLADAGTVTGVGVVSGTESYEQNPYTVEILADSPVAYYLLAESSGNAQDRTANANHATSIGGTPIYGQTGPITTETVNKAMYFTLSDYFSVPNSATLDLGPTWSVEFWIKFTNTSPRGANFFPITMGPGYAGDNGWNLVFDGGGTGSILRPYAFSTYGGQCTAITDTNWHHIVMSMNSGAYQFYIDGVADLSGTFGSSPADQNHALIFGQTDAIFARVAVYTTVLSGARALAHYNAAT